MSWGVPHVAFGTDWQEDQSVAFQQGQQLGRDASTVVATALTVDGTFKIGTGLAGLAAGTTCTVGTAGACAAVAAPAGVIEGGLIVEGAAEAAYGGGVLAYASGYVGILLSPFHLCLVLTTQYFGAKMKGVYRLLWMPSASIVGVAFVVFWLGRR